MTVVQGKEDLIKSDCLQAPSKPKSTDNDFPTLRIKTEMSMMMNFNRRLKIFNFLKNSTNGGVEVICARGSLSRH